MKFLLIFVILNMISVFKFSSSFRLARTLSFPRSVKETFGQVRTSKHFSTDSRVENIGILKQNITIVKNRERAKEVLKVLENHKDAIWACDTEVSDIDLSVQGPVGNGKVICVSIYGGEKINFGDGNILWVENAGDAQGVLQEFKSWFENPLYKKVWHNYGFDRHVLNNEGIDCKGFHGDTMHMARLWDTSLDKASGGGDGYSLEVLSNLFYKDDPRFSKVSMKDLFGVSKLRKDGSESKVKDIPNILELQMSESTRDAWIHYSAKDAVATWWVREKLESLLRMMAWMIEGEVKGNMYDFYMQYLKDFGELLTEMEKNGIKVDTKVHLKKAEQLAREERAKMEKTFLDWASEFSENVGLINIASSAQMQQLLFGNYENHQLVTNERLFKVDKKEEDYLQEVSRVLDLNPYANKTISELKDICRAQSLKLSGTRPELIERVMRQEQTIKKLRSLNLSQLQYMCTERGIDVSSDQESLIQSYMESEKKTAKKKTVKSKKAANPTSAGVEQAEPSALKVSEVMDDKISMNSKIEMPKKYVEFYIKSIGLKPIDFTPTGVPQVSASVLKKLAGKNLFGEGGEPIFGLAYKAFGEGEQGERACRALGALAAVGQIDTTINNFLVPLQALVDENSRIHCSLNLNTETGRLSSRRPNLQNQPALEKDQYKIRDAFIAEEGKTFIVADYGQLELRILAHVTDCKSMIEAFSKGGCFHSRTAVGMYDYIKKAIDNGEVLLEWDYSKGPPTSPLVKDTYGSERRKAKTLNFSIAYGKTVFGLASDWGITKEEAQETLDAWYRDRPEVKKWQDETQKHARKFKFVRTIMGRYRRLVDAGSTGSAGGHALRAAINTPIQGSAADVVMMAMLKLWKSQVLKDLGWKMLLQIHDEVILEGPIESRDQAMKEVVSCMENPFDGVGLNKLKDAKSADSWYKAK